MPRKDTQFKPKNKKAKGGKREGAGRKPGWLQELCEQELGDREITQLRAKIAAGEVIVTHYVDPKGRKRPIVRIPNLKDMQDAADWLADRAAGRAPQTVQHKGTGTLNWVDLIRQAEDERGLDRTV